MRDLVRRKNLSTFLCSFLFSSFSECLRGLLLFPTEHFTVVCRSAYRLTFLKNMKFVYITSDLQTQKVRSFRSGGLIKQLVSRCIVGRLAAWQNKPVHCRVLWSSETSVDSFWSSAFFKCSVGWLVALLNVISLPVLASRRWRNLLGYNVRACRLHGREDSQTANRWNKVISKQISLVCEMTVSQSSSRLRKKEKESEKKERERRIEPGRKNLQIALSKYLFLFLGVMLRPDETFHKLRASGSVERRLLAA